jgi:hypothetical protein
MLTPMRTAVASDTAAVPARTTRLARATSSQVAPNESRLDRISQTVMRLDPTANVARPAPMSGKIVAGRSTSTTTGASTGPSRAHTTDPALVASTSTDIVSMIFVRPAGRARNNRGPRASVTPTAATIGVHIGGTRHRAAVTPTSGQPMITSSRPIRMRTRTSWLPPKDTTATAKATTSGAGPSTRSTARENDTTTTASAAAT